MGKGKKKSGGGGAAAPAGPAMASDETLGSETLDAIEARHELELVEVKKVKEVANNRSTNYIHATTYFSFLYNQPIHQICTIRVRVDCVVVIMSARKL